MKISLDVRDFDEEMQRVERAIEKISEMEVDAKIEYATATLRVVTPVDTGKARKGWRNIKTTQIGGGAGGFIINEVEYISDLNNGNSKQAPKFFIEQVLSTIGLLTPE